MSDEDGRESLTPRYVPGFVYLDMDQVKSISARMGGGYIKEQIEGKEELEEESESLRARLMASIFNIGADVEGEITRTEADTSRSESVKGLHHYHFTLLESELEDAEGDWFHDLESVMRESEMSGESARERMYTSVFRDRISEGDIIRVQADMELSDVSTSLDLLGGFVSMMSTMQKLDSLGIESFDMEGAFDDDSKFAEMDWNTREQAFNAFLDMFSAILPEEYENMIIAELFPLDGNREHTVWSILDGEKLEGKPVELMAKYEKRDIPNCTLIARVDTITNDPSELGNSEELDSDQLGMLHHLVDGLASQMGLMVSYPSISVTPIAIYR
ncbi:hypothetical protein JCM30237_06110 [Halolamina litorea]|uniref:Uncharacterized protein n=1 Tax=Halolamina litorea TaxID=1515593 RepID=A0ABD6BPU4_9EURY|nr:hypothetical protein [Halolamina litorea]